MKMSNHQTAADIRSLLAVDQAARDRLAAVEHHDPHNVLGAHPAESDGRTGAVVRAWHPDASGVDCLLDDGKEIPMRRIGEGGLFGTFVPGATLPLRYRLRFHFPHGDTWERDDPYRFPPTLGDMDLHLFNEGNHRRLWDCMGAHHRHMDGVEGVAFAVWAPSAKRVSVVGDFCRWDGRLLPMRTMGSSGIWEIFVPGVMPGALYKYEIKTQDGHIRVKTDPFAFAMEIPPGTASRVVSSSYLW